MTQHTITGKQMTVVQLHIDSAGETHYSESLYNMTATGLMATPLPDISSGTRAFYLGLPDANKNTFFPLPEQQFMVVISGSILSRYSSSDICGLQPDNIVPVKTYSREDYEHAHKGEDAVAFIVRF